jgi:hypothetical protein
LKGHVHDLQEQLKSAHGPRNSRGAMAVGASGARPFRGILFVAASRAIAGHNAMKGVLVAVLGVSSLPDGLDPDPTAPRIPEATRVRTRSRGSGP